MTAMIMMSFLGHSGFSLKFVTMRVLVKFDSQRHDAAKWLGIKLFEDDGSLPLFSERQWRLTTRRFTTVRELGHKALVVSEDGLCPM
mmetsp:Transcript_24299/g.33292  ORF Transcript_24299/g.33292 Transcript_24299/m.33292 type:complete len:87 (+) Transcript_24299:1553-1813(+)